MNRSSKREPGAKPPARPAPPKVHQAKPDSGPARSESSAKLAERAAKALEGVVFIQLPTTALQSLGLEDTDADLALPVQTQGQVLRFDPSMIRQESVITGILRVLAWKPEHPQAERYRKLALALRPELGSELSEAGIAKAQARDWEVAEEIFLALCALVPESPEPILDLALLREDRAKIYRQESREERAEEEEELAHASYRRLLAMEPAFAPAFFHAAFFYLRQRDFERAQSLFSTYISLGEDEAKLAKARQALAKIEELGGQDRAFKEAYDFIQMGEEERGLGLASAFVERNPRLWNGWFLVGWASRRLGRWEEAAQAFDKALSLGADEVDCYNELALCRIELGELESAKKILEKALKLEPENVKLIVNLGALALRRGDREEALGFFRAALDLDPQDDLAREWISKAGG